MVPLSASWVNYAQGLPCGTGPEDFAFSRVLYLAMCLCKCQTVLCTYFRKKLSRAMPLHSKTVNTNVFRPDLRVQCQTFILVTVVCLHQWFSNYGVV